MYKNEQYDKRNQFYGDVTYDLKDLAKEEYDAHWNWKIKKWYFDNKRDRHEWDISYSNNVSDDARKLDNLLRHNDITHSIRTALFEPTEESDEYLKNGAYKSYENLVKFLLYKYGPVPGDYFDEHYKRNTHISRTKDGLEIHHIDENQYLYLSNMESCLRQHVPFECQKANRLVYCDKIEHLLLHIRIAEDYHLNEIFKYYTYGVKTLISKINDYYIQSTLPNDWNRQMVNNIIFEYEEYVCLLQVIAARLYHVFAFPVEEIFKIIFSSNLGLDTTKIKNKYTEINNSVTSRINNYSDYDLEFIEIFNNNLHDERGY